MAARVSVHFTGTSNFKQVQSQLAALNAQIAAMNKSLATTPVAAKSQRVLYDSILRNVQGMRGFETASLSARDATSQWTRALQRQEVTLRNHAQFRKNINNIVEKQLQLQKAAAVVRSRDTLGNVAGSLITPMNSGADAMTRAAMRANILNQAYQSMARNLVNMGKNLQWTGRQLTVGLTVPLVAAGAAAAKAAYDVDKELTRLQKVYGDLGNTTQKDLDNVRAATMETAVENAKAYGIMAKDTAALGAEFAAAGYQGDALQTSIKETARIMTLGEVERQDAIKATIAMQSAFSISSAELGDKFNFLNAIENQTSTTLKDLIEVVPRAANVIHSLGGSVEDLAVFTVAMKEGGIDAAQGANALRSGLARLLRPTKQTRKELGGFGIDIQQIVDANAGNLMGTLQNLGKELDNLSALDRQRAIASIFGTYQFNRASTLLRNLADDTSQTAKAIQLTGYSTKQLAQIADQEISRFQESASGKLKRTVAEINAEFAKIGTPLLGVFNTLLQGILSIVKAFGALPEPIKNLLKIGVVIAAITGPLIMIVGLMANLFGSIAKGLLILRAFSQGFKGVITGEQRFRDLVSTTNPVLNQQASAMNALTTAVMATNKAIQEYIASLTAAKAAGKGGLGVPPTVAQTGNAAAAAAAVNQTRTRRRASTAGPITPNQVPIISSQQQVSRTLANGQPANYFGGPAWTTAARNRGADGRYAPGYDTPVTRRRASRPQGPAAASRPAVVPSATSSVQPNVSPISTRIAASPANSMVTINPAAMASVAQSQQKIAGDAEKTTKAWQAGNSQMLGTVGMIGLLTAGGNEFVQKVSMGLIVLSLMIPLLKTMFALETRIAAKAKLQAVFDVISAKAKGQYALYARAGAKADALGGAAALGRAAKLKGAFAGGAAAVGQMGRMIAGMLGPLGLVLAAAGSIYLVYKMWNKSLEKSRKEQEQIDKGAKSFADIIGFQWKEANDAVQAYGSGVEDVVDKAKKAREANKELIEDLSKKNDEQLKRAVTQLAADARLHGATAKQAAQMVDVLLQATGRLNAAQLSNEIMAEVNFDDVEQTAAIAAQKSADTIKKILNNNFDEGNWESLGRWLKGNNELNTRAKQAAKDFGKTFAEQLSSNDIAGSDKAFDGLIANIDSQLDNIFANRDLGEEARAFLAKVDVDPNDAHALNEFFAQFENADALMDWFSTNNYKNDLGDIPPQLVILAREFENVNQAQREVIDGIIERKGLNKDDFKNINTLAQFQKALGMNLMSTKEAQEAYNKALEDYADKYGKEMSDEQKLQILNTYRMAAGLKPVTHLMYEFGKTAEEVASSMNVLSQAQQNAFSQNLAPFFSSLKSNLQDGIGDAIDFVLDKYDELTKAGEQSYDDQKDAVQDRYDAEVKALDDNTNKQIDAIRQQEDKAKALDELRQKMFERERTRIQRLAEDMNASIDFNAALRTGNNDEAARIMVAAETRSIDNALTDAEQDAGDQSEIRTKKNEARMDDLRKTNEAAREALAIQKDADLKALDSQKELYRRRRDVQRKGLQDQLDAEKDYAITSEGEWRASMGRILGIINQNGQVVSSKNQQWANMLNTGWVNAVTHAQTEIAQSGKWDSWAKNISDQATKGLLGMSWDQFVEYMRTGVKPAPPQTGGQAGGKKVSPYKLNHGGGPAGQDSGRGGRARNLPLFSDEIPTILQRGEYVIDKGTVARLGVDYFANLQKDKSLGRGADRTGRMHRGGVVAGIAPLLRETLQASISSLVDIAATRTDDEVLARGGSIEDTLRGGSAGVLGAALGGPEIAQQILRGLLMQESGGNYGARSKISSASGGYQYIDKTWNNYGGYPHAYQAPPSLQDQRAMADLMRNYSAYRNWEKAIAAHFYPAWASDPSRWNASPAPGNPSVRSYVNSVLMKAGFAASGIGAFTEPVAGLANLKSPDYDATPPGRGGWRNNLDPNVVRKVSGVLAAIPGAQAITSAWRSAAVQAQVNPDVKNSDHTAGKAVDIAANAYDPVSGAMGDQVAAAFRKVPGVKQVLWRTNTGGNHFNHVHVGFRHGGGFVGDMPIPSLRVGGVSLQDNMLANLHKNETVLTAPLSQKLNDGIDRLDSGGDRQYNITVNAGNISDPNEIANLVVKKIKRMDAAKGPQRVVR